MRMDMNVVSSRVLSPTGGARYAHGEAQSAGGISKVRGEGKEVNQRCVYTTHRTYPHQNPVVGLPHQTPDIHQYLDGLTSETSKNLDTSIVIEKFSPRNSFFDCKSSKTRPGGWAPNRCVLCSIPNMAKNKDYNYETLFLLQSTISSHTVSCQNTPIKMCLSGFCVETRSINFSHKLWTNNR